MDATLTSAAKLPTLTEVSAEAGDPRAINAATDVWRLGALLLQLGLLLVVFLVYRIEEAGFLRLATFTFGLFFIHYWLPFAYKEPFWIVGSLIGSTLIVSPVVTAAVLAGGMVFYAIINFNRIAMTWRLAILGVMVAALAYGRAAAPINVPSQFWPVFGSIFMFRLIIYVYDARFAKTALSFKEYCAYFFPLPNFYFLLFPVIDFQTQRRTFYQRNIHDIAQQGIDWMARGALQLALYRVVYHLKPAFSPETVTSFPTLVAGMFAVYLLYLRVSGQFHIIVGMLHLFGYDLPETHRRYLLAESLTDFWRRINIYWKDFMVKIVYFPLYFRFRKRNETLAQVIATACVFVVTWATHSYQWFWIRGEVLLTWPDTIFWAVLGVLVIVNVLVENRRRSRGVQAGRATPRWLNIAGTLMLIVVLWSLWNSPSVGEWLDVMTWWRIG